MGQTLARLNEKFLSGEDRSSLQESKGMLHDVTGDEVDLNMTPDSGDLVEKSPKTPQNVVKLKYDPRSPAEYNRTPIVLPLDGAN
jgi:hypothetical protein